MRPRLRFPRSAVIQNSRWPLSANSGSLPATSTAARIAGRLGGAYDPGMRRLVPATPLAELVVAHRTQLLAASERRHADDVRLFGSIARGEDTAESNVDLLVTLGPGARPLDLLSLACDAEDILGVHVDVGTVESLRPEVRQDALNDAVLL